MGFVFILWRVNKNQLFVSFNFDFLHFFLFFLKVVFPFHIFPYSECTVPFYAMGGDMLALANKPSSNHCVECHVLLSSSQTMWYATSSTVSPPPSLTKHATHTATAAYKSKHACFQSWVQFTSLLPSNFLSHKPL